MSATYDAVLVGYGPTGMVLAALLGRHGHRVAVVERYPDLYNLPRAATFDDEIARVFQRLGVAEPIIAGSLVQTSYEWHNAAGQLLMKHHFDEHGRSSWAEWYMMYQPHVEDVLHGLCSSLPNVELLRGWEVTELTDHPGVVALDATGQRLELQARYVIGCDGGNSLVREALQIDVEDFDFTAPWLVTDFAIRRPLDIPAAMQLCDPAQPTAIIRIGPDHQRFSFMLHADETVAHATDPANVWQRVSRWVTPEEVDIQRIAYYTFRSIIAREWSRGRVFLAGDAAHQMPPFLGQGMCSGIRDALNLAWKLDLVLRGTTDKNLLSTYEPERSPHVRAITEKAIELGRVQTLRDPEAARARDAHWLALRAANTAPERLQYPGLSTGLIDNSSATASPAGELFIQAEVEVDGQTGLFDDVAGGSGFVLIARGPETLSQVPAERFAQVGGRVASFEGPAPAGALKFRDVTGAYGSWLDAHNAIAVIVRPDFYVYGVAADAAGLTKLLDRLLDRIGLATSPV